MTVDELISRSTSNPKMLFLIDGLGALLSAFLLGVVLVRFESLFGMPREALYILAALPCFFAVYDLFCYWRVTRGWSPYLKGIAIINLLYCCISIGFVIHHFPSLTYLGLLYFVGELIIVLSLAYIEYKAANQLA